MVFITSCSRDGGAYLAFQEPNPIQQYTPAPINEYEGDEYKKQPIPPSPPKATPVNKTIAMGQEVLPKDMLKDISYTYPIDSIRFVYEPYLYNCGEQTLQIAVTDINGNESIVMATLTILPNETPPVIKGVEDIIARRLGTLLLRLNISAYDAFGNAIEFFVDSQNVDIDTSGVYSITYYAYDRWGNRAEIFAYVTITDVDIDWVYSRVDEILAGIITSDASQVEQARAVHTWMTRNISYAATIGLSGRYENVYQGLRYRRGNCFVYFYTAEIMLNRLGIPNRRIDRIGGATNHRWHLINPDDMGWHHMDTGPQHITVASQINTFMFTSSRATYYTNLIYSRLGRSNYYTYDTELHPYIVY